MKKNAKSGKTFQIYDEILPGMVERKSVAAYCHNGYWAYSRSLDEYYQSNMDCLGKQPAADLTNWNLHTNHDSGRIGDHPPILTGTKTDIRNSIISQGCSINGLVHNSVLSPMVRIESGAEIHDSLILEGSVIKEESIIRRSIIDKNVVIGRNARVGKSSETGKEAEPNRNEPNLLHCGLTIIGKNTFVPENMKIGTNVIIFPDVQTRHFTGLCVSDGTTVFP